jgi:hypothetical protein
MFIKWSFHINQTKGESKMKKINKYLYLHVIQGYYGSQYGWEDIDQSESRKEARVNYKLYCQEEKGYQHRMMERRELNPAYTQHAINAILGILD